MLKIDKIIIHNLEVYAYHGVFPFEKEKGQKFFIFFEGYLDFHEAGKSDDLNLSVNYGELCEFITEKFTEKKYNLIESCIEMLAKNILLKFKLFQKVKIQIRKPYAPINLSVEYPAVEAIRGWHKVFVGLGSNIGDCKKNINLAIQKMMSNEIEIIKTSSIYKTKPWGVTEQPDFFNSVIEIKTLFTPLELLKLFQNIEKDLKRERIQHWGPRTIDIDILLYDDLITDLQELTIPHPYMTKRLFVLTPMCEISPYTVHPIENKRIFEIESQLKKNE